MGRPRPLFHFFLVFSNKPFKFYKKIMSIQYPAMEFELMTFYLRHVGPLTTRPGLSPNSILFLIGKHWTAMLHESQNVCQNVTYYNLMEGDQ